MAEPKVLDADDLIDEILAKKGPAKYTDGLSEDNWEQELEQIPLFMTQSPGEIDPVKAPGLAALQALKYETETPQGRAIAHKTEGNEMFRLCRYSEAVREYSAALKERTNDSELNTVLLTNRAAAHYHLGNYRSALTDVTQAKTLKPDHLKALLRGALTCDQLGRFDEALQWCNEGLKVDPEHQKLRELRKKATKSKKQQERDERKQSAREKTKQKQEELLLQTIKTRGVSLEDTDTLMGPHPSGGCVHLTSGGVVVWPVLFMYPEYGQSDYIQAMAESDKLCDHIDHMFGEEGPAWDTRKVYTPTNMEVFYEHSSTENLVRVKAELTLGEALRSKGLVVKCLTPSFILLSTGSPFYQHYISKRT